MCEVKTTYKLMYRFVATKKKKKQKNKMPMLAFTRDAVADSFIPTVCFADIFIKPSLLME